jgi:KaiC/GvpD/RAD55 family RecA-like ATPase
MFKNAIPGLERILKTDVAPGSVILVSGGEGTLKSGLVFSLICGELAKGGEGLYATLEQSEESHMLNMNSMGIDKPPMLHIFDFRDMRAEWQDMELDMLKLIEEVLDVYTDRYPDLNLFALDSLNALYALSCNGNIRREMYHFFNHLRYRGLTSFLIMEGDPTSGVGGPECFLADGVIDLGYLEGAEGVKRYIRVRKMRAARHSMEKHQIIVGSDGISILGPIY